MTYSITNPLKCNRYQVCKNCFFSSSLHVVIVGDTDKIDSQSYQLHSIYNSAIISLNNLFRQNMNETTKIFLRKNVYVNI